MYRCYYCLCPLPDGWWQEWECVGTFPLPNQISRSDCLHHSGPGSDVWRLRCGRAWCSYPCFSHSVGLVGLRVILAHWAGKLGRRRADYAAAVLQQVRDRDGTADAEEEEDMLDGEENSATAP